MREPKEIAPAGEWSHQKKLLVSAAALAAAFLIGFIPSCLSALSAEQRAAEFERRITMADLLGQIGMTSYEANRNNYANASEFSTRFFDGLMKLIDEVQDEEAKKKLRDMLAARDEITTTLAQADPTVKPRLAQMYADFYQLTMPRPQAR